jgi:hypothetical protein
MTGCLLTLSLDEDGLAANSCVNMFMGSYGQMQHVGMSGFTGHRCDQARHPRRRAGGKESVGRSEPARTFIYGRVSCHQPY